MQITNNTEIELSEQTNRTVIFEASCKGVDEVAVVTHPKDKSGTLFQVFDTKNNYLFSIDTFENSIVE